MIFSNIHKQAIRRALDDGDDMGAYYLDCETVVARELVAMGAAEIDKDGPFTNYKVTDKGFRLYTGWIA